MASIDIDRLAAVIAGAVREYTDDVTAAIEKEIDEVAGEVREAVVGDAPRDTGDYAKGFKVTKQGNRRIVWNKKHSGLVHLLEFGHAKVNGGRVMGKPHMRPAYDRIAAKLPERIKEIIKNGG